MNVYLLSSKFTFNTFYAIDFKQTSKTDLPTISCFENLASHDEPKPIISAHYTQQTETSTKYLNE
jgi:hypothetical protein